MKVLGTTSNTSVFIGSKDRNFRMNEFLIVDDKAQGPLIGEIIEAQTYNKFIPLEIGGDFVDSSVIASLTAMGYDLSKDTIYIGRLRLLKEALYPILAGSSVRIPEFDEVKNLLTPIDEEKGLTLGIIKNTDDLYLGSPDKFKNLLKTFEDGEMHEQRDLPFIFNFRSMHEYPHIGIFGGSGSGKSFGLRVLLEEFMKKSIPGLVLDPHYEMDFSNLTGEDSFEDKFICLTVGVNTGIKFEDLSQGDLKILLSSVSELSESMNNAVDVLFKRGENIETFRKRLEYLIEAQDLGKEKIEKLLSIEKDPDQYNKYNKMLDLFNTYDKKVNNASLRGLSWRLNSLIYSGIFNRDISEIEKGIKKGKLVVVQGSTKMISIFSSYVLNKLYSLRRDYRDSLNFGEEKNYFPPFIIVTDEAHNFAPKAWNPPSKSILREISQEGRKYGVFLILASQRPTLLDETITAQLNSKFIFRTVRASDIDTIREETDISSEEAKRLPYLTSGDVFISSSQLGRTSYVRIRYANTESPHKENPFDELNKMKNKEVEDLMEKIKNYFPIDLNNISNILDNLEKHYNLTFSEKDFRDKLNDLVEKDILTKETTILGDRYNLK